MYLRPCFITTPIMWDNWENWKDFWSLSQKHVNSCIVRNKESALTSSILFYWSINITIGWLYCLQRQHLFILALNLSLLKWIIGQWILFFFYWQQWCNVKIRTITFLIELYTNLESWLSPSKGLFCSLHDSFKLYQMESTHSVSDKSHFCTIV